MNFLLTDREEKNKKYREKEVKIMKKLGILLTAVLIVLAGSTMSLATIGGNNPPGTTPNPQSIVMPDITPNPNPQPNTSEDIIRSIITHSLTTYNEYGIAIGASSYTISGTTIKTCDDYDGDGQPDAAEVDVDGDNYLDTKKEDTNGNGVLDDGEDLDGDGHLDVDEDIDNNGLFSAAKTWITGSVTTTASIVISEWIGGSLKTAAIQTTSATTKSNDKTTSFYVDTYTYSPTGDLLSVSGSGNYYGIALNASNQPETATIGTITRNYQVVDGQALLTKSVTAGETYSNANGGTDIIGPAYDADGVLTGIGLTTDAEATDTFVSGTMINFSTDSLQSDYQYLGGNWVAMKETQFSEGMATNGLTYNRSAYETSYSRDANGAITGLTQTQVFYEEGTLTGKGTSAEAKTRYTADYAAIIDFSLTEGWYIKNEAVDVDRTTSLPGPQSGWNSAWSNKILPF